MRYTSLLNKFFIATLLPFIGNNCVAQLNPMLIGTRQPGDSIVIYYDVTINSGLSPTVTKISNQGAVTGTGINIVTDDPDTPAPNDFTFSLLNGVPLPVTLTELRAIARTTGIDINWNTSFEISMIKYEVEKSTDGRTFTKIGEVRSLNSLLPVTYSFFDPNPNNGINFYRLRLVDHASSAKYSTIVRVDMDGRNSTVKVYPNPPVDHTVMLQISNMQKGNYDLLIYSNTGQLVYRMKINHAGGSANKNISLPASLPKGSYSLQLSDEHALFQQQLIIR